MRRVFVTMAMAVFTLGSAAYAQEAEQQKLMAKRAAEADAYRKLAEAVYGIELNSRTTVRDFVTESDEIRGAVDAFIRGIRLGEPRWESDGTCSVPAEVTVAKVIETLQEVYKRSYKGDAIKSSDFESISKRIEKSVIKAVGQGAPRPDLPPDLPMGVAEQLGAPPAAVKSTLPAIWSTIPAQSKLMATRAARMDALRRLAERIKGLRLSSKTQVRDFVTESDVIDTELNSFLKGAEEVGDPYYHNDELIVEVKMHVPTEQVITTVKELHAKHYKGDELRSSDIEHIVKEIVTKDFETVGMGVPPPQAIKQYAAKADRPIPEWVSGTLEIVGNGTDPEMDTPQGRLRAARAATLDGYRKLEERVHGLQLNSSTLVRDFVAQHDDIDTQVSAVIHDATVGTAKFTGETAEVTVSIQGMRVWGALNDGMGAQR